VVIIRSPVGGRPRRTDQTAIWQPASLKGHIDWGAGRDDRTRRPLAALVLALTTTGPDLAMNGPSPIAVAGTLAGVAGVALLVLAYRAATAGRRHRVHLLGAAVRDPGSAVRGRAGVQHRRCHARADAGHPTGNDARLRGARDVDRPVLERRDVK